MTNQACWSPMGLRLDISVSDGTPMRYGSLRGGLSVSDEAYQGLQWVSDQVCRSPMVLQEVFDRSPMGLQLVSDNNNIFVNSR